MLGVLGLSVALVLVGLVTLLLRLGLHLLGHLRPLGGFGPLGQLFDAGQQRLVLVHLADCDPYLVLEPGLIEVSYQDPLLLEAIVGGLAVAGGAGGQDEVGV